MAIACAVLALLIIPPLLGGIAIYLGFQVKKKNPELGQQVIIGAIVATIAGMVIGAYVFLSA